ncbi:hypothetical protein PP182_04380 [Maribacter sp. PR1]|uniref:Uncharacterized protein n=1 Tax=Maribacter cobaltidurans TaxID=1178778 RepID=A0ABU7IQR4_9FLAO|nr:MULTISPECIES: hypothetical protein [Maribacter]MDC6387902.1 hypothetical protein [Maribacter sp. PR1]MEE1975291.1 hypothetical protein [Maribacter cobaltidurans]
MKKLQEFNNSSFFARYKGKIRSPKSNFTAKLVSILSFTLLFMLSFNMSCKENKYTSENDIETKYMSTTNTDPSDKVQEMSRVSREKVIEYLQKLHLISDPMNYKIELTNDELHIDGKRQPDKVHRHIIDNFVQNPKGHLQLTYTVSTD